MSGMCMLGGGRNVLGGTTRILAAAGLLLIAGAAAACDTAFRSPGHFDAVPAAESAGVAPISADELFPLEPQTGIYQRNSGERAGREYEYELRREGEHWVFELDDRHRLYLEQRPDGGIAMRRYENLRRDVQVEAEPAMLMLPGEVDNAVHEGHVRLTVHGLLGRRTMRGEGLYRLRVTGTRLIDTPEGEREAYIVQQQQQLRMPLAQAQVQLETAYVAGLGRMMDQLVREHRVLGLFGDDVTESYQRVK